MALCKIRFLLFGAVLLPTVFQKTHPAQNIAIKAAHRAGQITNRASNDIDLLKVTVKQIHDYVTEVDRAAEAAIIEIL